MPNLVPLYGKDKKIFSTTDGSFSFFNLTYNEAYRAKSVGAYNESLYKFVLGSGIIDRLKKGNVKLLDICFGLGYNLAITIDEAIKSGATNRLEIISLEIDRELPEIVKENLIFFPYKGYEILRKLLKSTVEDNFSLNIHFGDASKTIFKINKKFDVIFFDPFSKSKNPEMWDIKIFKRLYDLLDNDGVVVTYACSKKIRKEFEEAGFKVFSTPNLPNDFQPGTLLKKSH